MLLRRVMESDGTYLMHNNRRVRFDSGFQVGVYLERPTFFLFDEVQAYVIKMLGIDEQMEVIGNIFSVAEHEIINSCESGHPILEDLLFYGDTFEKMYEASFNQVHLTNFLPDIYVEEYLTDGIPCVSKKTLNLFGGIWEDKKEQIHVDASTWVQDLDAALELGKKYNQETIWDWSIMKCRCTKTGDIIEY